MESERRDGGPPRDPMDWMIYLAGGNVDGSGGQWDNITRTSYFSRITGGSVDLCASPLLCRGFSMASLPLTPIENSAVPSPARLSRRVSPSPLARERAGLGLVWGEEGTLAETRQSRLLTRPPGFDPPTFAPSPVPSLLGRRRVGGPRLLGSPTPSPPPGLGFVSLSRATSPFCSLQPMPVLAAPPEASHAPAPAEVIPTPAAPGTWGDAEHVSQWLSSQVPDPQSVSCLQGGVERAVRAASLLNMGTGNGQGEGGDEGEGAARSRQGFADSAADGTQPGDHAEGTDDLRRREREGVSGRSAALSPRDDGSPRGSRAIQRPLLPARLASAVQDSRDNLSCLTGALAASRLSSREYESDFDLPFFVQSQRTRDRCRRRSLDFQRMWQENRAPCLPAHLRIPGVQRYMRTGSVSPNHGSAESPKEPADASARAPRPEEAPAASSEREAAAAETGITEELLFNANAAVEGTTLYSTLMYELETTGTLSILTAGSPLFKAAPSPMGLGKRHTNPFLPSTLPSPLFGTPLPQEAHTPSAGSPAASAAEAACSSDDEGEKNRAETGSQDHNSVSSEGLRAARPGKKEGSDSHEGHADEDSFLRRASGSTRAEDDSGSSGGAGKDTSSREGWSEAKEEDDDAEDEREAVAGLGALVRDQNVTTLPGFMAVGRYESGLLPRLPTTSAQGAAEASTTPFPSPLLPAGADAAHADQLAANVARALGLETKRKRKLSGKIDAADLDYSDLLEGSFFARSVHRGRQMVADMRGSRRKHKGGRCPSPPPCSPAADDLSLIHWPRRHSGKPNGKEETAVRETEQGTGTAKSLSSSSESAGALFGSLEEKQADGHEGSLGLGGGCPLAVKKEQAEPQEGEKKDQENAATAGAGLSSAGLAEELASKGSPTQTPGQSTANETAASACSSSGPVKASGTGGGVDCSPDEEGFVDTTDGVEGSGCSEKWPQLPRSWFFPSFSVWQNADDKGDGGTWRVAGGMHNGWRGTCDVWIYRKLPEGRVEGDEKKKDGDKKRSGGKGKHVLPTLPQQPASASSKQRPPGADATPSTAGRLPPPAGSTGVETGEGGGRAAALPVREETPAPLALSGRDSCVGEAKGMTEGAAAQSSSSPLLDAQTEGEAAGEGEEKREALCAASAASRASEGVARSGCAPGGMGEGDREPRGAKKDEGTDARAEKKRDLSALSYELRVKRFSFLIHGHERAALLASKYCAYFDVFGRTRGRLSVCVNCCREDCLGCALPKKKGSPGGSDVSPSHCKNARDGGTTSSGAGKVAKRRPAGKKGASGAGGFAGTGLFSGDKRKRGKTEEEELAGRKEDGGARLSPLKKRAAPERRSSAKEQNERGLQANEEVRAGSEQEEKRHTTASSPSACSSLEQLHPSPVPAWSPPSDVDLKDACAGPRGRAPPSLSGVFARDLSTRSRWASYTACGSSKKSVKANAEASRPGDAQSLAGAADKCDHGSTEGEEEAHLLQQAFEVYSDAGEPWETFTAPLLSPRLGRASWTMLGFVLRGSQTTVIARAGSGRLHEGGKNRLASGASSSGASATPKGGGRGLGGAGRKTDSVILSFLARVCRKLKLAALLKSQNQAIATILSDPMSLSGPAEQLAGDAWRDWRGEQTGPQAPVATHDSAARDQALERGTDPRTEVRADCGSLNQENPPVSGWAPPPGTANCYAPPPFQQGSTPSQGVSAASPYGLPASVPALQPSDSALSPRAFVAGIRSFFEPQSRLRVAEESQLASAAQHSAWLSPGVSADGRPSASAPGASALGASATAPYAGDGRVPEDAPASYSSSLAAAASAQSAAYPRGSVHSAHTGTDLGPQYDGRRLAFEGPGPTGAGFGEPACLGPPLSSQGSPFVCGPQAGFPEARGVRAGGVGRSALAGRASAPLHDPSGCPGQPASLGCGALPGLGDSKALVDPSARHSAAEAGACSLSSPAAAAVGGGGGARLFDVPAAAAYPGVDGSFWSSAQHERSGAPEEDERRKVKKPRKNSRTAGTEERLAWEEVYDVAVEEDADEEAARRAQEQSAAAEAGLEAEGQGKEANGKGLDQPTQGSAQEKDILRGYFKSRVRNRRLRDGLRLRMAAVLMCKGFYDLESVEPGGSRRRGVREDLGEEEEETEEKCLFSNPISQRPCDFILYFDTRENRDNSVATLNQSLPPPPPKLHPKSGESHSRRALRQIYDHFLEPRCQVLEDKSLKVKRGVINLFGFPRFYVKLHCSLSWDERLALFSSFLHWLGRADDSVPPPWSPSELHPELLAYLVDLGRRGFAGGGSATTSVVNAPDLPLDDAALSKKNAALIRAYMQQDAGAQASASPSANGGENCDLPRKEEDADEADREEGSLGTDGLGKDNRGATRSGEGAKDEADDERGQHEEGNGSAPSRAREDDASSSASGNDAKGEGGTAAGSLLRLPSLGAFSSQGVDSEHVQGSNAATPLGAECSSAPSPLATSAGLDHVRAAGGPDSSPAVSEFAPLACSPSSSSTRAEILTVPGVGLVDFSLPDGVKFDKSKLAFRCYWREGHGNLLNAGTGTALSPSSIGAAGTAAAGARQSLCVAQNKSRTFSCRKYGLYQSRVLALQARLLSELLWPQPPSPARVRVSAIAALVYGLIAAPVPYPEPWLAVCGVAVSEDVLRQRREVWRTLLEPRQCRPPPASLQQLALPPPSMPAASLLCGRTPELPKGREGDGEGGFYRAVNPSTKAELPYGGEGASAECASAWLRRPPADRHVPEQHTLYPGQGGVPGPGGGTSMHSAPWPQGIPADAMGVGSRLAPAAGLQHALGPEGESWGRRPSYGLPHPGGTTCRAPAVPGFPFPGLPDSRVVSHQGCPPFSPFPTAHRPPFMPVSGAENSAPRMDGVVAQVKTEASPHLVETSTASLCELEKTDTSQERRRKPTSKAKKVDGTSEPPSPHVSASMGPPGLPPLHGGNVERQGGSNARQAETLAGRPVDGARTEVGGAASFAPRDARGAEGTAPASQGANSMARDGRFVEQSASFGGACAPRGVFASGAAFHSGGTPGSSSSSTPHMSPVFGCAQKSASDSPFAQALPAGYGPQVSQSPAFSPRHPPAHPPGDLEDGRFAIPPSARPYPNQGGDAAWGSGASDGMREGEGDPAEEKSRKRRKSVTSLSSRGGESQVAHPAMQPLAFSAGGGPGVMPGARYMPQPGAPVAHLGPSLMASPDGRASGFQPAAFVSPPLGPGDLRRRRKSSGGLEEDIRGSRAPGDEGDIALVGDGSKACGGREGASNASAQQLSAETLTFLLGANVLWEENEKRWCVHVRPPHGMGDADGLSGDKMRKRDSTASGGNQERASTGQDQEEPHKAGTLEWVSYFQLHQALKLQNQLVGKMERGKGDGGNEERVGGDKNGNIFFDASDADENAKKAALLKARRWLRRRIVQGQILVTGLSRDGVFASAGGEPERSNTISSSSSLSSFQGALSGDRSMHASEAHPPVSTSFSSGTPAGPHRSSLQTPHPQAPVPAYQGGGGECMPSQTFQPQTDSRAYGAIGFFLGTAAGQVDPAGRREDPELARRPSTGREQGHAFALPGDGHGRGEAGFSPGQSQQLGNERQPHPQHVSSSAAHSFAVPQAASFLPRGDVNASRGAAMAPPREQGVPPGPYYVNGGFCGVSGSPAFSAAVPRPSASLFPFSRQSPASGAGDTPVSPDRPPQGQGSGPQFSGAKTSHGQEILAEPPRSLEGMPPPYQPPVFFPPNAAREDRQMPAFGGPGAPPSGRAAFSSPPSNVMFMGRGGREGQEAGDSERLSGLVQTAFGGPRAPGPAPMYGAGADMAVPPPDGDARASRPNTGMSNSSGLFLADNDARPQSSELLVPNACWGAAPAPFAPSVGNRDASVGWPAAHASSNNFYDFPGENALGPGLPLHPEWNKVARGTG
ncbi:hypothetical protein BESB_035200 [Besnoitia besnoiti]|uniref:AP2 domain transcription factor AP2X-8 n=1 Tax=Besnoitia besnoiti TaxID=94643 RepID=A0A2A9MN65_BESBE|nr:hypothetical protein BESB_035200 [Besnoitia besnoiti]PFH37062.1 hypothetical protein BESB_035200 [Besnoitia besnoiti]